MLTKDLRTGMFIVFGNSEVGKVFMNTAEELHDNFFVLYSEGGMSHKIGPLQTCLEDWRLYDGVVR